MGLEDWVLNEYDKQRSPLTLNVKLENRNVINNPKNLSEITCPICLGILRDTMTTKECLHRFCNGCIIAALRNGNKECPTCRKKLISKRSLRPDPNFDAIISIIHQQSDNSECNDDIYKENYAEANRKSHSKLFRKQLMNKKRNSNKNLQKYLDTASDNSNSNVSQNYTSDDPDYASNGDINPNVTSNDSTNESATSVADTKIYQNVYTEVEFKEAEIVFYPFYNNNYYTHENEEDLTLNEEELKIKNFFNNKIAHVRMVRTDIAATVGHMKNFLLIRQSVEAKNFNENLKVEIFTSISRRDLLKITDYTKIPGLDCKTDLTNIIKSLPTNETKNFNSNYQCINLFYRYTISVVSVMTVFSSSFSISAICYDRYKCIVHPLNRDGDRNRLIISICSVWIISIFGALPTYFLTEVLSFKLAQKIIIRTCSQKVNTHYLRIYSTLALIVQFLLPLIIITIFNITIIIQLKSHLKHKIKCGTIKSTIELKILCTKNSSRLSSKKKTKNSTNFNKYKLENDKTKKNILILSLIAIIFAVCWLPLNILNFIIDYNYYTIPYVEIIIPCCHIFGLLSACINPIIYGWLNKNLRQQCITCFKIKILSN
ncbi:E3 ubiquitin-protein ligase RING2 [Intoshia linei]|uniref:E3 ubiquitin-protein ligase RING2 n=1 Tax=Intoshia linei TaxID=1819745 RepID=A0A177AZ99_9BILA|nr:E3 ubiquitin-protein ligase RING2 [Intoshia linei]